MRSKGYVIRGGALAALLLAGVQLHRSGSSLLIVLFVVAIPMALVIVAPQIGEAIAKRRTPRAPSVVHGSAQTDVVFETGVSFVRTGMPVAGTLLFFAIWFGLRGPSTSLVIGFAVVFAVFLVSAVFQPLRARILLVDGERVLEVRWPLRRRSVNLDALSKRSRNARGIKLEDSAGHKLTLRGGFTDESELIARVESAPCTSETLKSRTVLSDDRH